MIVVVYVGRGWLQEISVGIRVGINTESVRTMVRVWMKVRAKWL